VLLVGSLTFVQVVLIGWFSLLNYGTALDWAGGPALYVAKGIGHYLSSPLVQQGTPFEDLFIFGLVSLAGVVSFLSLSFRKAVSVICLFCMELTTVIMFFDPGEFYMHVTGFQAEHGIIPWFTNADLLLASTNIFLLMVTWSAVRLHYVRNHRFIYGGIMGVAAIVSLWVLVNLAASPAALAP
jgi:hypothetical protein